jgi:hypothetical protein
MVNSIPTDFLTADNKVMFSNSTATATAKGKGVFICLLHTMSIVNDEEGTGFQMVDSDGNIIFCCTHVRLFCLTLERKHTRMFVLWSVYKRRRAPQNDLPNATVFVLVATPQKVVMRIVEVKVLFSVAFLKRINRVGTALCKYLAGARKLQLSFCRLMF